MPSQRHRRRSPSPAYSSYESTDYESSDDDRRRSSHRSHKRRDEPPAYEKTSSKRSSHRPEVNRSYSDGPSQRESTSRRHKDRGILKDREGERRRERGDRAEGGRRDRGDREYAREEPRGRDVRDVDNRRRRASPDYDSYGRRGRNMSSSRSRSRGFSRSRSRGGSGDGLKSIVEDVLAAFGLVSSKHSSRARSRSRSRSRGGYPTSSNALTRGHRDDPRHHKNPTAALRAAITAAALEAYRTRKDGMSPQRIIRVAGAAIAAGGLDAIVQRNDRGMENGGTRKLIESVIGGMKSSNAFGHRIRRRHGLTNGEHIKNRLVRAATSKILDRQVGPKDDSLAPKFKRSTSSNALSSLVRSLSMSDKRS